MKSICIISPSYFPNIWNGQGRSTFSTAYILASLGHEVNVFTYTPKSSTVAQNGQVTVHYVGNLSSSKPNVTTLPFESISDWNMRVLEEMKKYKFTDIILISSFGWEAASMYRDIHSCKTIGFVPFLYTFTGWLRPLAEGLEDKIKVIESKYITEVDELIAHTQKFGRKLADYSNRNITVIPNCYLDFSKINGHSSEVVEPIPYQLCFVGRCNREKSLERVIRILPEMQQLTFCIASPMSSKDYYQVLYSLAKKLDVEDRVKFIGWQPTKDIKNLYRASALAIVPNQFEPFGYAALDPMALGVPVIVSEWSSLEEYIGSPDNTFNSLPMLADKISSFINLSARASLVSQYEERINKEYSIDVYGQYLSSLL